jgi:hypothetical protein
MIRGSWYQTWCDIEIVMSNLYGFWKMDPLGGKLGVDKSFGRLLHSV